jgi:aldehyde dehydrogenase (NAD+)
MSTKQMIHPPLGALPAGQMFVGGKLSRAQHGSEFEHFYAATGESTGTIKWGGKPEVEAAIRSARESLEPWKRTRPDLRRRILLSIADSLERNADDLVACSILENGTPRRNAISSVGATAELFRYNAGWSDRIQGDVVPVWPTAMDYAIYEPYGVVAVIIPWNGPVSSIGMVVAPALAAGNTIVLKSPELAPYTSVLMAQLFLESGLPPGVVNVIPGGPEVGHWLVGHPDVDKVHFTGSTSTARAILNTAAVNVTPCALELGGKSANIVFEDADLPQAAKQAVEAITNKAGQGCIRGTRLLVPESVYDEVVELCASFAAAVELGDPWLEQTQMGPVVSAKACERILAMVNRVGADGRVITGGQRASGEYSGGYFIPPTVVVDVDPMSELAQTEVFGPVLAVLRIESEEHAVKIANGTPYALAAYIQTTNLGRAHSLANKLRAGNVWINGFAGIPPSAPFGGVGDSGFGRLGGWAGVQEFLQLKNVWIATE